MWLHIESDLFYYKSSREDKNLSKILLWALHRRPSFTCSALIISWVCVTSPHALWIHTDSLAVGIHPVKWMDTHNPFDWMDKKRIWLKSTLRFCDVRTWTSVCTHAHDIRVWAFLCMSIRETGTLTQSHCRPMKCNLFQLGGKPLSALRHGFDLCLLFLHFCVFCCIFHAAVRRAELLSKSTTVKVYLSLSQQTLVSTAVWREEHETHVAASQQT